MRGCKYRTEDDVCTYRTRGSSPVYCESPCPLSESETEELESEKKEIREIMERRAHQPKVINTGLHPVEYCIFSRALEAYGYEAQEKMLLEEMSELQKEICKSWRGKDNSAAIAEEMADVSIMLDQMKIRFQNFDAFNEARKFKILRLTERLKKRNALCPRKREEDEG